MSTGIDQPYYLDGQVGGTTIQFTTSVDRKKLYRVSYAAWTTTADSNPSCALTLRFSYEDPNGNVWDYTNDGGLSQIFLAMGDLAFAPGRDSKVFIFRGRETEVTPMDYTFNVELVVTDTNLDHEYSFRVVTEELA